MKIQKGTEPMVFSFAYYKVKDYGSVVSFFKHLHEQGLFGIDQSKPNVMSGSFIQDYPKGHWNPLAKMLGAKQVLGGAEIKEGVLKIDTRTKTGLVHCRKLLETALSDSIEFEKEEFQDVMEMLRKK